MKDKTNEEKVKNTSIDKSECDMTEIVVSLIEKFLQMEDTNEFIAEVKEQYGEDAPLILKLVEKSILELFAERSENMMNKCHTCIYKKNLSWTHHIACTCEHAGVVGDSHGIKKGWFMHPYCFDPVWLKFCTGYKEQEK